MNTPTPREEFIQWLATVKYDNSDILSPSGLAWAAWQAASEELTAAREEIKELNDKLDDAVADATNAVNDIIRMKWQRDRLAEAMRKIKNAGGTYNDPYDELDFIDGITYEALQSLTKP